MSPHKCWLLGWWYPRGRGNLQQWHLGSTTAIVLGCCQNLLPPTFELTAGIIPSKVALRDILHQNSDSPLRDWRLVPSSTKCASWNIVYDYVVGTILSMSFTPYSSLHFVGVSLYLGLRCCFLCRFCHNFIICLLFHFAKIIQKQKTPHGTEI